MLTRTVRCQVAYEFTAATDQQPCNGPYDAEAIGRCVMFAIQKCVRENRAIGGKDGVDFADAEINDFVIVVRLTSDI